MSHKLLATLLTALLITIGIHVGADARGKAGVDRPRHASHHPVPGPHPAHPPLHAALEALDLTDAQRTELEERVTGLREQGATRPEIREAIVAFLEAEGVEVPIYLRSPAEHLTSRLDLTDEQLDAIQVLVADLQEQGKTGREIMDTVLAQLEEWGIDVPDRPFVRRAGCFLPDLTEEQRSALRSMIEAMRSEGADRQEIRDAVHTRLAEWGLLDEGDEVRAATAGMVATLAIVDAEVQAAPSITTSVRQLGTTWGALKANR